MSKSIITRAALLLHTLTGQLHEGDYCGYIQVLEHGDQGYAVVSNRASCTWIPVDTSWRGAILGHNAKAILKRQPKSTNAYVERFEAPSMFFVETALRSGGPAVRLSNDLNKELIGGSGQQLPDGFFAAMLDLARPALDQDTTIPPTGMDIDLDHLARVRTYLRKASRAPTERRAQVLLRFGGPLDPVIIASKDPDFRCTTLMMPVHPRRELRPGQWVWS